MNGRVWLASVLAVLLLSVLVPIGSLAAENTDAYIVMEESSDRAVKGEESPKYDYLEVRVVVQVNVTGQYNLTSDLMINQREVASAHNASYLSPGRHGLLLRFSNGDVYNGQGIGKHSVMLSLQTPNFPFDPVQAEYTTAFYHYTDFQPDYKAPYPAGSEFSYSDGDRFTSARNNFISFQFDKSRACLEFHFTGDGNDGRNGRFSIAFNRTLGYMAGGGSYFTRQDVTHQAVFSGAPWKVVMLQNGTHRLYGPFLKFAITYTMDMVDIRLDQVSTSLNVTFFFYFTGNAHPSSDRSTTIAAATQAELTVTMELARTIGGSGLVLEQVLTDTRRNHDFLLRDAIGDLHRTYEDRQTVEQKLIPRTPDSAPKISFKNRWDGLFYGVYSWATPHVSTFEGANTTIDTDVSFLPEGPELSLFLAFRAEGSFLGIQGTLYFGLEGRIPPPKRPPPAPGEYHDPVLYLLGSLLALAIIFLTMRLRSRSYVEEEAALDRLEERELEGMAEAPPAVIEERVEGEEEAWRRSLEGKGGNSSGGGGPAGGGGGGGGPPKPPGHEADGGDGGTGTGGRGGG